jgi:hypothetical protein
LRVENLVKEQVWSPTWVLIYRQVYLPVWLQVHERVQVFQEINR